MQNIPEKNAPIAAPMGKSELNMPSNKDL